MKKTIKFFLKSLSTLQIQLGIALFLAFTFSLTISQDASTQTQSEDDWTPPVNLSNSGSTSDPIVLVDSQNITHVIWFDRFEGYRHSQVGEDGVWSDPVGVSVPFDGFRPRVILGPNDFIYTFWLNEGSLLYSRVSSENFGLSIAWGPAQVIAGDTLAFDVFVDDDKTIHLAYLMESDAASQSAGVYYLQKPAGRGWAVRQTIYTSQYFRTMRPGQAHVSVAAGNLTSASSGDETRVVKKQIFVAWDEPFMFRSMISSTTDGSNTWVEPSEIDPITAATRSTMAFEPDLTVWNDQVLLVWKKKLSETTCEIQYKVAPDGQNWNVANDNFSSSFGCPESSGFLVKRDDLILWHAIIGNQVILTAWDGSHWSEPITETELTGFRDSVTGQTLAMGSRALFYQTDFDNLLAVGCDVNGSQDVWFTRKSLNDMADWFLPFSSWKPVQEVALAPYGANDINIITDSQGNFHTLWVQVPQITADNPTTGGDSNGVVHYARWDGTSWSDPSAVVSDNEGNPLQMSAVANQVGDLMVVWRSETGCQISFSRVSINRAFNSVEWVVPVTLPTPVGICSSPTLATGVEEVVYAAYSVAVNEGRGIYLNRSTDGGDTWDEPTQVFDAKDASWEMVDQPVLAISGSRLHILWQHRYPLDPGLGQGLGYAYSDDEGMTWSVADTSIEETLQWAGLSASTNGLLTRVWQQEGSDQPLISTQISKDDGKTWSSVTRVAYLGEILGTPNLIVDPSGGTHLLHIIRDYLGKITLRHWVWDDDNWMARESLHLGHGLHNSRVDLSGAISPQEQLAVVYTSGDIENGVESLSAVISQVGTSNGTFLESQESQEIVSPTNEAITPTEAATQTLPVDPALTPAATTAFSTISEDKSNSTNTWVGLILGTVLAFVVVAGVFWKHIGKNKI